MLTPRQILGLRGLCIFSGFLLLFLSIAVVQSAGAVSVEGAAAPPSLAPQESRPGDPKPQADTPLCNPDWVTVSSPDPGVGVATLGGVAAVSADDVWAVGYYQNSSQYQTLILHWDGSAWSVVGSPNVGTDNNYLNAIAVVSADDIWAVGYHSAGTSEAETITLHWDGSTWSVVSSPSVASSFNYLSAVDAVSAGDVWAVGKESHAQAGTSGQATTSRGGNWPR